jgi:hypothetical protein
VKDAVRLGENDYCFAQPSAKKDVDVTRDALPNGSLNSKAALAPGARFPEK